MYSLDNKSLLEGTKKLGKKFIYFKQVILNHGPPPLWQRDQGFHTLVRIILEQQVSLKSAQAAYDKLVYAIGTPSPSPFLSLDDATLKKIGFSRQKTLYCRELAQSVMEGRLDIASLDRLPDSLVIKELTSMKGIGVWTANIYLLMALGRPDVWPKGDLALEIGYQRLVELPLKPSASDLVHISNAWKPWRAVAARLIYHYYLNNGK